ncbi:MAG: hypothetical protein ABJI60_06075 [Kangiellaceae bacterium]
MKKSLFWILLTVPLVILILTKYEILTDPERAFFVAVSSDSYHEWEVNYLLKRISVPSDDNYLTLQAIVINEHFELLERYVQKIPKQERHAAYEAFKNITLSEDAERRLRSTLGAL